MSRKNIFILVAVLVMLVGGGFLFVTNTPAARVERELKLANKYLQEVKYQEAILAFQKVISIEPKNIPARLGLGQAYVATSDMVKAETVLKEVLEIEPDNIPAREALVSVYLKQGKIDEADAVFKDISRIDPKRDVAKMVADIKLAKTLADSKQNYALGVKQMDDKKYLDAVDSFKKVIKEDTDRYPDAQTKIDSCQKSYVQENVQKAKDAADQQQYDSALSFLELALKVDPNNQEVLKLKSDYTAALEQQKAIDQPSSRLQALGEGRIPEVPFGVGTPIGTILAQLGAPDKKEVLNYEGTARYYHYGNVSYLTYELDKNENDAKVTSIMVSAGSVAPYGVKVGEMTLSQVQELLGVQKLWHDTEGTDWGLTYVVGKYEVYFFAKTETSPVYECFLKYH